MPLIGYEDQTKQIIPNITTSSNMFIPTTTVKVISSTEITPEDDQNISEIQEKLEDTDTPIEDTPIEEVSVSEDAVDTNTTVEETPTDLPIQTINPESHETESISEEPSQPTTDHDTQTTDEEMSNTKDTVEPTPVYKLFRGIVLPKNQVQPAIQALYKTKKDPSLQPLFSQIVKRILSLTNTLSDYNLPILIKKAIPVEEWTTHRYIKEMDEVLNDLKETIRAKKPYGSIETLASSLQLSPNWLLYGSTVMDDDLHDGSDDDDNFLELAIMTGDATRPDRHAAHTAQLSRRHKPVNLPSLETVKEELGDIATYADLDAHIEDLTEYNDQHTPLDPILPDTPNITGINGTMDMSLKDLSSNAIKRNYQKLPPSKVDRFVQEYLQQSDLSHIPLDKLIDEIVKRLPQGSSLTLTGYGSL